MFYSILMSKQIFRQNMSYTLVGVVSIAQSIENKIV